MPSTHFTVDVNVSTRDFWSEAARKAAAEARKAHASAKAGRTFAKSVKGKDDAKKQIKAAAEAHAKQHGDEHGKHFEKAATEHHARSERSTEAAKAHSGSHFLKRPRKIGAHLLKSALESYRSEGKIE